MKNLESPALMDYVFEEHHIWKWKKISCFLGFANTIDLP